MCQYAVDAQDGVPGAWHTVHYGSFAIGGFGLVIAEATGVTPEGRITPFDTGLWNDEQAAAWSSIVDFAHSQGAAMAVQLGHAGRKASTNRWWPGYPDRVLPPEEGGWRPVGVVDEDAADGLTEAGIEMVVDAFVQAARRADAAGFDAVEVHAAHGYLLHQFYSPLSNTRSDAWGGDHAGRTRLVRTVARRVRAAFPQGKPVLVRLSATDWVDGGWSIEDSVRLGAELRELGVDLVDVSSGGGSPRRPSRRAPVTRSTSRSASGTRQECRRRRWASSPTRPTPRRSWRTGARTPSCSAGRRCGSPTGPCARRTPSASGPRMRPTRPRAGGATTSVDPAPPRRSGQSLP